MYPFRAVESKWQKRFEENKSHQIADFSKNPCYILEMLPYPSGKIHMGHVRNYSIGDAMARFYRAKGYSVLHPMGWDAFGLPAENAAMEQKKHPKTWTYSNIETMRTQLKALGLSYDWSREFATCDELYYGLEQKIFLDFYDKGLAYRKESWVNFDPVEQSVLANEQVINGRGWRSGALVERKKLTQWSIKITAYAEELLNDLKKLTKWPDKVLKMQENWIGKSVGAHIHFNIDGSDDMITVFTTKPHTLFGASFVAIAPHHPFIKQLTDPKIKDFIGECDRMITTEEAMATMEKKGMWSGYDAQHPLIPGKKIPIYIANFVLSDYGTGALFGCPAHDTRDFEFAHLYNLPVHRVIDEVDQENLPFISNGGHMINSDFLNGMSQEQAFEAIINYLEEKGFGSRHVTYRLRDWLVSRQRYWGCPIPIIYCDQCGTQKAPLPVVLPQDVSFDRPGNPLDHHPTWKYTTCSTCQGPAIRETDTLDTFFESSWYFLRYCCPQDSVPVDSPKCDHFAPVDLYIGGIEHAVLHLLYARFFTKALRDLGYVHMDEPFQELLTQGMVCHVTYQDSKGKWVYPTDVKKDGDSYSHITTGEKITLGRLEKMSKSKKNVVDPQDIIDHYGADCARLFILSDTPPDKDFDWNDDGLDGCGRYLNRLYRLMESIKSYNNEGTSETISHKNLLKKVHKLAKNINDEYEKIVLNKVVALCREMTYVIEDAIDQKAPLPMIMNMVQFLLCYLQPIIPHITHEIEEQLAVANTLKVFSPNCVWMMYDPELLKDDQVTYVIQVNGKLKGQVCVPADAVEYDIKNQCLEHIRHTIKDATIQKEIFVKGRLVNFVVN